MLDGVRLVPVLATPAVFVFRLDAELGTGEEVGAFPTHDRTPCRAVVFESVVKWRPADVSTGLVLTMRPVRGVEQAEALDRAVAQELLGAVERFEPADVDVG